MEIRCPQCGKPIVYSKTNEWRPFCSKRCKLIDFGDWIEEKNRIPDDISLHEIQTGNVTELKH